MTVESPGSPLIYADVGVVKFNALAEVGLLTAANSVNLTGDQAHTINSGSIPVPLAGPGTFTFDMYGLKIPWTLELDIDDAGTPRTDSYDMGPSNTSQSFTLSATETLTDARGKRRF